MVHFQYLGAAGADQQRGDAVGLPAEGGSYPTLLVRDIYTNGSSAVRLRYAKFATANGYAFVFQSSRGRYDSEGDWYPYFDAHVDRGAALVERQGRHVRHIVSGLGAMARRRQR